MNDFVPLSQEERLTFQFTAWEKRGRGWDLYPYPVVLEPPFRPFWFHFIPSGPIYDDVRKPTFFSKLADRLLGHQEEPRLQFEAFEEIEPEPELAVYYEDTDLIELQITLPPDTKILREATEQFLVSLTYCSEPMSFEIVGFPDEIILQLVCRDQDLSQLKQQLEAYFPQAAITLNTGYLTERWCSGHGNQKAIVDFGLSREFMLPLKTFTDFNTDPLAGITGALAELRDGEIGLLQILFQPARSPWPDSIMRAVTDYDGKPFFADAPLMIALARSKISQPLFAAVIRVAAQSPTHGRAWQIAKVISGTLAQFSRPSSNELIPLTNDNYNDSEHEQGLLYRHSQRSGMLLNSEELVSLLHLPSESVRTPKFKREIKKTKTAPAIGQEKGLRLGENYHAGKTIEVGLTPDQRTKHMYVIGASGTGKSTLLLNCILQDIENGDGIGVLDPHGDLIEQILGRIPEKRFSDVVLFDPSDADYPVGFNILSAHSELEKNLLASDFVSVFRRLSTSWGDQMTSVLSNAVLAYLESDQGGTLADLRRFLIEPEFRREFLKSVHDPEVIYYWQKTFPLLAGKPQGPLLTRLDTFLRPKLIRYMVAQKENKLDFRKIMDEGQIFLAKLSQGAIGEDNAYLLGTLIVSKLNQLVLSRQEQKQSERRNFYLYIDEFHNFITPSMASILSGARKYALGLILAHQELNQVSSEDAKVASAVMSNPYTRICFRLGDQDARKLSEGFSFFEPQDLQNLGIGEAIGRIERAEYDFNLKTGVLPHVDNATAADRREKLVALSREKYAASRADVEALLAKRWRTPEPEEEPPTSDPGTRSEKPAPSPVKAPKETAKPGRTKSQAPALPGRGGSHHKSLQDYIKDWGEKKGFQVTIEKPVLDGLGSVDVALEKEGCSIACEVSVTSSAGYEMGNIQKCLAAGFDHVVLVSSDKDVLKKAREKVTTELTGELASRVRVFAPEQLFQFIRMVEAKAVGKMEPSGEAKEVLTVKELEKLINIDAKTIYSYAQRGLIPYVKIQSNLRFLRSEILKWLEEHRFRPKPPGSGK